MEKILYDSFEHIKNKDYVIASYYIKLAKDKDVFAKAKAMAVGQTIGTWIEVPGITSAMRENHMGKIINIFECPGFELDSQILNEERQYIIQVAFPLANFDTQFTQMFTTLLGNDASTSSQVKLLDVIFPDRFLDAFAGPKFGIEGLRKLTHVEKRPLLLNMIKPCTGLTPEQGAKIFYDTAIGGVDFIKDDELLGNTSFSPVVERVKHYNNASKEAFKITGKETIYIANVTDRPDRILQTVDECLEAGAKALMLSFSVVGYDMFAYIRNHVNVPILGHYATSGVMNEGLENGLSSHLTVGKFPRIAGADLVMMNTPYGGYPLTRLQYMKTGLQLIEPLGKLKASAPILGGGVHPGMVKKLMDDFGNDIVLAAGGAIQGHPQGAKAGVTAMYQAMEAYLQDIPCATYAKSHEELQIALETFQR